VAIDARLIRLLDGLTNNNMCARIAFEAIPLSISPSRFIFFILFPFFWVTLSRIARPYFVPARVSPPKSRYDPKFFKKG
jgi:hypothetical protein